jgi:hypothetical protein
MGPWRVERFLVTVAGDVDYPVEVTVVIMAPPPSAVTVALPGDTLPVRLELDPAHPPVSAELTVGVTPWRWGPRRVFQPRERVPVGVVQIGSRRYSEPVVPYWALVAVGDGGWGMVPQEALVGTSPAGHPMAADGSSPPADAPFVLALGAFYPLIEEGRPVADGYPGRAIRAARVAVGGAGGVTEGGGAGGVTEGGGAADGAAISSTGGGSLILVATTGSRPGAGAGREGLTTGELAAVMERYSVQWALNLDGGRSAWLIAESSRDLSWLSPPRRPGPVSLELMR